MVPTYAPRCERCCSVDITVEKRSDHIAHKRAQLAWLISLPIAIIAAFFFTGAFNNMGSFIAATLLACLIGFPLSLAIYFVCLLLAPLTTLRIRGSITKCNRCGYISE